jgi:hypothetical protein
MFRLFIFIDAQKYFGDKLTSSLFFTFFLITVFENRFLRRTFGPRREAVSRDWRKLLNEELHSYFSPVVIRMIDIIEGEMGGTFSMNSMEYD